MSASLNGGWPLTVAPVHDSYVVIVDLMAAYYYTVLTVLIFARDSKVLVYVSIHIKQTTSSIPGAMPFFHFSNCLYTTDSRILGE